MEHRVDNRDRIDLAHAEPLRIGIVTLHPPLRQIVRDDGGGEVLEPRVMQVLLALARADGAIVTRDELTQSCWEGRVVGEDAINRVISRLRRVSEGIGKGCFRIETVTKVGYRLVSEGRPAEAAHADEANPHDMIRRLRLDRRAMLAGSGLAVVAAGGVFGWWHLVRSPAGPPSDVAPLMEQAKLASRQGTAEGASQAMGLLRRVTEMRPDYADGWGFLAMNYAGATGGSSPEQEVEMRLRAEHAIRRTFALDPDNPYARLAQTSLLPTFGRWKEHEAVARSILADHGDNEMAWAWLCGVLVSVGRCNEAADAFTHFWKMGPPDPARAYSRVVAYWSSDRIEEADKAAAEAAALFPTHFAIWFTRYYLLLYTGRAQDALAMSRRVDQRPTGIPPDNFTMIEEVAHAMITRAPADIDRALATNIAAAHKGAGFAENTIQFAAALGRVDTAFEVAEAYFFGRGFDVGELRFQPEQRVYTRRNSRRTRMLFMPSTAAMRADPRFDRLVGELGLKRYWAETRSAPDYLRS